MGVRFLGGLIKRLSTAQGRKHPHGIEGTDEAKPPKVVMGA
jgi:hypothetical protein